MKNKAVELKKEGEATKIALEEAEKKLRVSLEEAEEAKAAEARALDQIKTLSERTNAACASTSVSGANITISKDEFESLSQKVEESDIIAEMKVTAAMAQVEAVKASENGALKSLEATQKEIEDTKTTTAEALKRAEMAEAAKRAVEGELRRRRQIETKQVFEEKAESCSDTKHVDLSEENVDKACLSDSRAILVSGENVVHMARDQTNLRPIGDGQWSDIRATEARIADVREIAPETEASSLDISVVSLPPADNHNEQGGSSFHQP